MSRQHQPDPLAAFRDQIAGLSDATIKRRYRGERETHVRILNEERATLCTVHAEFRDFRSFLGHVGPKPHESFTLDRINNDDAEYGPGKVQWAAPVQQANNRRTTIKLRGPDGTERPLTEWARLTGQEADTMRRRRPLGWSDAEIIAGHRDPARRQRPAPQAHASDAGPNGLFSPKAVLADLHPSHSEDADPWPEGVDGRAFEPAYQALLDSWPVREPELTRHLFTVWSTGMFEGLTLDAVRRAFPGYDAFEHDAAPPPKLAASSIYQQLQSIQRLRREIGVSRSRKQTEILGALRSPLNRDRTLPALIALGLAKPEQKRGGRMAAAAD